MPREFNCLLCVCVCVCVCALVSSHFPHSLCLSHPLIVPWLWVTFLFPHPIQSFLVLTLIMAVGCLAGQSVGQPCTSSWCHPFCSTVFVEMACPLPCLPLPAPPGWHRCWLPAICCLAFFCCLPSCTSWRLLNAENCCCWLNICGSGVKRKRWWW